MTFEQLSYDEQKRLWTNIAKTLLEVYGLHGAELALMTFSNNAVFNVQHRATRYILRLHRPGLVRGEWIQSEMIWLKAIREQTDIIAPYPVTLGDEIILSIQPDNMAEPIYAALFYHIDGQTREPSDLKPIDCFHVGVLLRKLHCFAQQFQPPPHFSRPWLDWEGLFGGNSPYNPGDGARIFTDEQRHIFGLIGAAVRSAMDELGQSADVFGLIHADLLLKNILFHQDQARPLDFEYGGWGYYLYDLTPLLWQLRHDDRYDELRDALWEGYNHQDPLPKRHWELLDTFIVGRHLASCRWIAGNLGNANIRDSALGIITARTEEMRRYLQTGRFP